MYKYIYFMQDTNINMLYIGILNTCESIFIVICTLFELKPSI